MNFEFKKVGWVAKIERIRYSTIRQGARTMNFEFKKATGEYQEFIRPDASGGKGTTRYTDRKGACMMNFEFKKATGEYQEFIRPDASGGRDATRYTDRKGARMMNFEFKKDLREE